MSKAGKILFVFAFLFAGALVLMRAALGGWQDFMWVPFGISVLLFVAGVTVDRKALFDFLTLKTTKHGMNMGAAIAIALVGLVCINVLGVRYDKQFDWTSEKLNSLSDQSVKAVQTLKADTEVLVLYNPEDRQAAESIRDIGLLVGNYQNVSKHMKYSPFDARQRPDLTKKYEMQGPLSVFLVQGERNVRVTAPTEEGITRGLLQLAHDKKKVLYFITGHGERDIEGRKPEGMSAFKEDLAATYETKTLSLLEKENKIPEDAGMLAIISPKQQYLESELKALRDFAKGGGHLLIAIDPDLKHNLAQLTKTLGVEFNNDYVVDPRTANMVGLTTVAIFDKANAITQPLPTGQIALFYKASSLQVAPQAGPGLTVSEIAQTDHLTLKQSELAPLSGAVRPNGPHTVGVAVKGQLHNDTQSESSGLPASPTKEFSAVIFGDGDFFANGLYVQNLNRDLAMNSFAYLMQDTELISIRPKELKATQLNMLDTDFALYSLLVLLALPLAMLLAGGTFWFRRRLA